MALTAKLIIKGHSKENKGLVVSECQYSISREIDGKGRPYTDLKIGIIDLVLASNDDFDLINWMISEESIEGEIIFYNKSNDNPISKIKFKDAIIVEYNSYYSSMAASKIKIKLTAKTLSLANTTYEKDW